MRGKVMKNNDHHKTCIINLITAIFSLVTVLLSLCITLLQYGGYKRQWDTPDKNPEINRGSLQKGNGKHKQTHTNISPLQELSKSHSGLRIAPTSEEVEIFYNHTSEKLKQ
jgi:hypothetical protein